MNLLTAHLHRRLTAIVMVIILGSPAARAFAEQPPDKPLDINGPHLFAQREPAERPDSPAAKETGKPPQRAWWDTEPGPLDEQRSVESMRLPPGIPPRPPRDGFRDLESELSRRAEMILRELVELPAGSDAESRRLESELKQVREEIARLHQDFGRPARLPKGPAPDLFEVMGERLELTQRAIDVQCLIYELGDENREQVGDLEDELKEINARLEEIVAGHPELKNDREFLKMQIEFHRRAFSRMRQLGKPEAADRFMREQLALVQRLQKPLSEPRAAERGDFGRRIEHVEVAIDNLRAAGLHDFAESLVREMERMVDEQRRLGPDLPIPPGRFAPPDVSDDPYPVPDRQPDRAELHSQMDRMQREMDELRSLVKKLLEQNGPVDRD